MKSIILFFVVFIFFNATAQKKLSVVYEINNGGSEFKNTKHLLAINDSVSFSTIIFHRNKETKYSKPLGSGFSSHDTYIDLKRNLVLFQSKPFNHPEYLVTDTIKKLAWETADGEKEVLGHICKKAVAKDGETVWVAWYSPDLPFYFGPNGIGGLPGLILELTNISFHRTETAIKIENDSPEIVEPTKGKKVTSEEFQTVLKKCVID
jgi:GLPGLI family protein